MTLCIKILHLLLDDSLLLIITGCYIMKDNNHCPHSNLMNRRCNNCETGDCTVRVENCWSRSHGYMDQVRHL